MIKTVWTVIWVLVLINALMLVGLIGWLDMTGRLNNLRVARVKEIFQLTIEAEQEQLEQAKELEAQARKQALDAARLESLTDGPITLADRLSAEQEQDELAIQRVERLQRDIHDLQRQFKLAKQQIGKQRAQLEADQQALDAAVQLQVDLQQDQDFQLAVRMYEQLKPKQAKQMLRQLIAQGQKKQVVDYLASMQLRKAASVLKEFKTPSEEAQATDLIQSLRLRGVDPIKTGRSMLKDTQTSNQQPGETT